MPPNLLEIVLLGIVQGIGEFLPISSSGHVVVLATLFDQLGQPIQEKLTVNIALHAGTLLSIVVVYWRRLVWLLGRDRRIFGLLVVGSVPAAIVGVPLKLYLASALESAMLTGWMFLITGLMLLWSARRQVGTRTCAELSYSRALLIGAFQALAILPGVSRSGATIVAGLGVGLNRQESATFAFLLAVPAILGASFLEAIHLLGGTPPTEPVGILVLGMGVSFLVGLFSLWWLLQWLETGRLHRFAWWVLLLGPIVITWQLW